MKPFRLFIYSALWLLIFVPLTVTSTPPSPWLRSYRVHGHVLDATRKPVAGMTVAFAVRCHPDSALVPVTGTDPHCGCPQSQGTPSARTDAAGAFSLNLVSCGEFDSLALAVLPPGGIVTQTPRALSIAKKSAWTQDVPQKNQTYFFCASSTGYTSITVGSIYNFPADTVTFNGGSSVRLDD
ncbi:MAG TPA: hypothetical protein VFH88_04185 [Candidatus Krumholzibacteria bacterium]|nr:hypothetical protein [Candidatus Krumholzibacteria bacterium]